MLQRVADLDPFGYASFWNWIWILSKVSFQPDLYPPQNEKPGAVEGESRDKSSGRLPDSSVADPDQGYEIRCLFDPWFRDPGWVKKSGSGSEMNNPNHIFESLETIFWG